MRLSLLEKNMKIIISFLTLISTILANDFTIPATIQAKEPRTISSQMMGHIKALHVKVGDSVKKGQILYEIDSNQMDSNRLQVELSIAQAKLSKQMHQNQLSLAKRNLARHERLLVKDMVAKADVEGMRLEVENLESLIKISDKQISQAQSQLKAINSQYEYLKIKAPIGGMITKKWIGEGEMAMPGTPALQILDLESLEIWGNIPERYLGKAKPKDTLKVQIPSVNLEGSATVRTIVPVASEATFKIVLDLPDEFKGIYPGMFAQIFLSEGQDAVPTK